MANEVPKQNEPSVTSLMSGIVSDIQDLIKQQMRLTRQEIVADLRQSKDAALFMGAGSAICYVALFAVCLMVAHLIHWLSTPVVADAAAFPMWGSYALAAALFLIVGGILIVIGRKKLETMGTPLHETAVALKENLEWKTKTSPS